MNIEASAQEPAECPNCPHASNCQLTRLTVSQLSHLLVLIGSGVVLILRSAPDGSVSMSGRAVLGIGFTVLYCLVVVFYFIGSWELEEKWFEELGRLRGGWRVAEIAVRVLILFAIIFSVSIYSDIVEARALFPENVDGTLFILMSIFWLFLLWDTLVVWGDANGANIVRKYFPFDVVGCVTCFVLILVPSSQTVIQIVAMVFYLVVFGGFLHSQLQSHVRLKLGGMR